MPRITRSSYPSSLVDEEAENPLLTKLSHGWYTEETLISVLGEHQALKLLNTVSKGAQDGYVLISDVAKDTGQNHGTVAYYLRYPQMRSFEPIRVSACVWMRSCRTLSPLMMFKGFEQLGLFSGEVIPVSPENHLLKFLLRYGGVGEVDKIPRIVVLEVLLELLGNFKLVGVSPIQQAPEQRQADKFTDAEMDAVELFIGKVLGIPDPLEVSQTEVEKKSLARLKTNRKKPRTSQVACSSSDMTASKHSNFIP